MPRSLPRRASAALIAGAVVAGLAVAVPAPAATALDNPILGDGSVYSADPATLVVDDTLYVYAGRDEAGPTTNDFIMNEWQAFSTADVGGGEWERHPALMRPEQVFDWATPGRAYAGQVVEGADGRFYWYVPVHEAGSDSPDPFGIGVAVSDTPSAPGPTRSGRRSCRRRSSATTPTTSTRPCTSRATGACGCTGAASAGCSRSSSAPT